jgi:trehalose 6-phosphate phosphatase
VTTSPQHPTTLVYPRTEVGRAGLSALLADPARAVLALDFDGTLAPIVPDPTQARAHPGALPALTRLAPRLDSVLILTGRPAATAAEYAGLTEAMALGGLPHNIVVLGQYGVERWDTATGELRVPDAPEGVAVARRRLPAVLLEGALLTEGAWIEDKGRALAVHTRRCPDPEGALAALREPIAKLAAETDLVVEPGRLVLELRPPGGDKGTALREYVRERGARCVAFAGDDLGDLPAFAEVTALRATGVAGLTVCSASTEVTELTRRADLTVDGPDGVVAFLEWLLEELSR